VDAVAFVALVLLGTASGVLVALVWAGLLDLSPVVIPVLVVSAAGTVIAFAFLARHGAQLTLTLSAIGLLAVSGVTQVVGILPVQHRMESDTSEALARRFALFGRIRAVFAFAAFVCFAAAVTLAR
jgi:hypothetical protein